MPYTITHYNGAALTTVNDGTVDTTTNLTLVGKNYAGYGQFIDENFVYLLENFANVTSPVNPLVGQLWWDSGNNVLKVYTGTTFKPISSSTASATAPIGAVIGDLWFNTVNQQLNVYNGSSFVLIGPSFTSATGQSGAVVGTVIDTTSTSHVVVYFYVANVIVGILSKDALFTPQTSITGFSTIAPGFNLASTGTIAGIQFTGTASNANAVGGLLSTQFMRSDSNTSTTGTLGVVNNSGLTVGAANDLQMSIVAQNAYIQNTDLNGNLYVQINKGGTQTPALTIAGATSNVTLNAALLPTTTNTQAIGSPSLVFSNVYATTFTGTANQALYADISERHHADAIYEPGTVVSLGGNKEITMTENELCETVFGVISTNPAVMMNCGAGSDDTHPYVALGGRVPVKATGIIKKGDRLVSAGNGFARAGTRNEITSFNVIGRALEDKLTNGEGVVEATVKIN